MNGLSRRFLALVSALCLLASTVGVASADGRGMTEAQWERHKQEIFDPALGRPGRIELASSPSRRAASLRSAAAVAVNGRVVDQTGAPVAGASVVSYQYDPVASATLCPGVTPTATPSPTATPAGGHAFVSSTTTDAEGGFVLYLDPGTWNVYATKSGLIAGSDYFKSVAVGPGGLSGVTLGLINGTVPLTGTIRDSAGTPFTGGVVYLSGYTYVGAVYTYYSGQATIGPTGAYSAMVLPGTWTITPYPSAATSVRAILYYLTVESAATTADVTFPALVGTIAGAVRDTTGAVVPNPYVYGYQNVAYPGGSYLAANSYVNGDASGNFALPVSAGNWLVYATGYPGYAYSPYFYVDAPAAGVTLRPLHLSTCIQGRISFPRATPTGGYSYVYGYYWPVTTTPGEYYSQYGYADRNGNYSLPTGPGDWRIGAAAQDFVPPATRVVAVPPNASNVDFSMLSRTYLPADARNVGGW